MDSKIRKEVEERRDKLLKSAAILDEMLKTGDASLYEKEYWDKVVDDFIDNAPDDMIGFWDLIPHKESKNDIRCKTFNSGESSNLILQNLRRI